MQMHLEDHLMWLIALPQAECRAQVRSKELLLLDGSDEGLVDALLVIGAAGGELLLLGLVGAPVAGLGDLVEDLAIEALHINGGAGGDDIAGIDSSEWDTVDLEWTGNKEDTLTKVLEEDDTLATESTGEQDEDGAGF